MKKIANFSRYSQFADLLALLIEQDVPMQEALVLAAVLAETEPQRN